MSKNAVPLRFRIKYMFACYKTQRSLALLRKVVPICALAILLVLSVCYIAMHPLNKIKLRYAISDNFTMKVSVRHASTIQAYYGSDTEKIVDGDLMQVNYSNHTSDRTTRYYKYENDGIYEYYTNEHGYWRQQLVEADASRILDYVIDEELLDPDNYKRVKGKLFEWELKEEVYKDLDGYTLSNIRLKRSGGYISIVGEEKLNAGEYVVTISFKKFGGSRVKPLWEK